MESNSFLPYDSPDYFNTDNFLLPTSNLDNDNSFLLPSDLGNLNEDISFLPSDLLNADDSLLSNDLLEFQSAGTSLPSTNFINVENTQPLTEFLTEKSSLPLTQNFNSDNLLLSTGQFNTFNSLPPKDFLKEENSLPLTFSSNNDNLIPSTDHVNTYNSFPPADIFNMSNSLVSVDCPQESWINHLSPNINEHMTQISTSELEFTAEPFSYTYDQEKRLSVSTMPIFPIFDASQNEEIHRETLRRNTVPDILPSQLCQFGNFFQRPIPFMPDYQDQSRINLMTYLSENILLPAKVSEESSISNTMFKHSWTDIGQIREWESFSLEEFNKMPSFQSLLNRSLPSSDLSTPSRNCNTSDFNGEYFAAKINLALSQSQKPRNLKMLVSKNQKTKESIFLSSCVGHNGTSGNDHRIVGLRKHLNGWDLLCEEESSKVKKNIDYLESLAHLHYYLREYGCRYGFILTDLNLIVVRHGTEETPNFGFLETKIFSLDSSKITEFDKSRAPNELIPQNRENLAQKGPALLALWYLHMLAGDRVIPGHASWDIDTGSYSNKSKHRFLRRDVDLLKILDADVRRAKRRKGWTTPWEIKAPRSRQRITASTQHPSREMANNKDASRKNLKNNPESIETRPYKKH